MANYKKIMVLLITTILQATSSHRSQIAYIYKYLDHYGKIFISNKPPGHPENKEFILKGVTLGMKKPIFANKKNIPIAIKKDTLLTLIDDIAHKEGVNPSLARAVVQTESSFQTTAKSRSGAVGLMQLMPNTARRFGVSNLLDPCQNVTGGVRYLKWLVKNFKYDLPKALAAYNAGEGAVLKYNGLPPYAETRAYVPKVLKLYNQYLNNDHTQTLISDNQNHQANSVKQIDNCKTIPIPLYCWTNQDGRLQITDKSPTDCTY